MKKTIKTLIIIALIFISTETINATSYSYDFVDENETILKCTYGDKYVVKFEVRNNNAQTDLYMNGNLKDKIAEDKDKKPSENALNKNETSKYIMENGKCPEFLSIYKKKYVFADSKTDLEGSSEVYSKTRTKYDKNYCFYRFEINYFNWSTNQRDTHKLGVFVKKDKFSNFANTYEQEECPAALITEMQESTKPMSELERKFYASDTLDNDELLKECRDDALQQIKDIYQDDEIDDGPLCKIAPKQDLISDGSTDENENFDPTNEEQIGCDGLFDYETKKFISSAYFILQIIGVLILIAFTIKDYASAILNSNADELKKANKNLITRLIVLIILLLLPSLLNLLLKVFKIKAFNENPLCGTVIKQL